MSTIYPYPEVDFTCSKKANKQERDFSDGVGHTHTPVNETKDSAVVSHPDPQWSRNETRDSVL